MKPESHHALMELISYGMEELSNDDAALLMSRVHECHECTGQWVLFQKTYTVLTQTGQTEVSVERSQQMWLTCLHHAKHKQIAPQQELAHMPAGEVVPVSFRSDSSQREGDRRNPSFSHAALQFLKQTLAPRLPYAAALGAAALLATAYFASPRTQVPTQFEPQIAQVSLPNAAFSDRSVTSRAALGDNPPHATTGLIDYHSTMGFEPFSDHLAPSLIAVNATRH